MYVCVLGGGVRTEWVVNPTMFQNLSTPGQIVSFFGNLGLRRGLGQVENRPLFSKFLDPPLPGQRSTPPFLKNPGPAPAISHNWDGFQSAHYD